MPVFQYKIFPSTKSGMPGPAQICESSLVRMQRRDTHISSPTADASSHRQSDSSSYRQSDSSSYCQSDSPSYSQSDSPSYSQSDSPSYHPDYTCSRASSDASSGASPHEWMSGMPQWWCPAKPLGHDCRPGWIHVSILLLQCRIRVTQRCTVCGGPIARKSSRVWMPLERESGLPTPPPPPELLFIHSFIHSTHERVSLYI